MLTLGSAELKAITMPLGSPITFNSGIPLTLIQPSINKTTNII